MPPITPVIILSFESGKKYFKAKQQNKIVVIGNPIRKELLSGDKIKAKEIFKISSTKPVILILGGSQGAQKINEIVINFLPRLLEIAEIIHSCGTENYKFVGRTEGAKIANKAKQSKTPVSRLHSEDLKAYKPRSKSK